VDAVGAADALLPRPHPGRHRRAHGTLTGLASPAAVTCNTSGADRHAATHAVIVSDMLTVQRPNPARGGAAKARGDLGPGTVLMTSARPAHSAVLAAP
jgi:hypothetical protein